MLSNLGTKSVFYVHTTVLYHELVSTSKGEPAQASIAQDGNMLAVSILNTSAVESRDIHPVVRRANPKSLGSNGCSSTHPSSSELFPLDVSPLPSSSLVSSSLSSSSLDSS
jgi:hypothetical protein